MTDQPRRVLLFYTGNGLEKWKAQVDTLRQEQEHIRDRDIEVKSIHYSKETAAEFRKWDIESTAPFTFILIGRDGGEKLRSSDLVTIEKLFGLIDAMPMRKAEMKRSPR